MAITQAFDALGRSSIGQYLAESTLAFAATQSIHLLGLAGIGGTVFIVTLSALGLLFKQTPPAVIAKALLPWLIGALIVIALSGLALVAAGPEKYLLNPLFPWKFLALLVAAALHIALYPLVLREGTPVIAVRAVAGLSAIAWLTVAIIGRWVGLI